MPEVSTDAPASDELLVGRARGGDRSALDELFRRHWGVANRVAFRLLGHEQDALDAVQEGLIKALTHLGDFDGRSGFRTWLLRIVTNSALDLGRKKRRRPALSLGDDANGSIDPAVQVDPAHELRRDDLRNVLASALDQLSPKNRAAFVLFAEEGLSYEEISKVLGTPIGTVMSRIYYARQKLQSRLEGVEGL